MVWPTLRKPSTNIIKQVLTRNPPRQEKEGPKNTWRRDLDADIKQTWNGWHNWKGLPNTGGAGEMLWMAYAPGGVKVLCK